MSRKIILVGWIEDELDRDKMVAALTSQVSGEVEWQWVSCTAAESFQPSHKAMNRLIDELRKWKTAKKKVEGGGLPPIPNELVVVRLAVLNGRATNQLFLEWEDPLQVPVEIRTSEQLIQWLRSPEAQLFPSLEWWAGVHEAALVAILCKLLSKKRWNASVQGHHFMKEEDLLTQSPVVRDDRPTVAIEARRILPSLEGKLLLTKGAAQGKTPKEWSIDSQFLPLIKSSILSRSLSPLRAIPAFEGVLDRIDHDEERIFRLDEEIVNEKVRFVCRQRE